MVERRPFSAATRQENTERLEQETFDLLVVGGGITGAAIARDAAMRGIRTALVEKDDFGSGTSSRSSRLIHGGIRYLEYYQFKLVFQACGERHKMREIAPRLVRPLPFLYPLYRGQKPAPWKLRVGLTLYDALGLFRNIQRHRWLRPPEVRQREPLVAGRGLLGAARFYDAQADDARLVLATVKSAHFHGAVVANYARAARLMKAKEKVVGACVVDEASGRELTLHAQTIINATGVWGDQVRELDDAHASPMLRPTKGIHLVINRGQLRSQHAVVFDAPRDGRHVFLIPWGDFALIGTTDTDYDGDLNNPAANAGDVVYLLEAIRHAFPGAQIGSDDIISTFAGLRPLIAAPGGAYAVSREHEIIESSSGLITIVGGKLTTHRLMAEKATDRVQEKLAIGVHPSEGRLSECRTEEPLQNAQIERARASTMDDAISGQLLSTYGDEATRIVGYTEENPRLRERIVPGRSYILAEVPYAVQHEMALTLRDVLVRRTHVIHETQDGGMAQARAVAELMAPRLGWDEEEIERQVTDYTAQVKLTQQWRT